MPPEPPNQINSLFTIPQINSLYFLIRASRFSKFYCGRLLVSLCAKQDHDKVFNYKIGSWEVLCNCASQRNICTKEQVRHKKIFVISTSWLILPRASSGFLVNEEWKFTHLTMLVTGCRLLLLVVDGGGGWLLVVSSWLVRVIPYSTRSSVAQSYRVRLRAVDFSHKICIFEERYFVYFRPRGC